MAAGKTAVVNAPATDRPHAWQCKLRGASMQPLGLGICRKLGDTELPKLAHFRGVPKSECLDRCTAAKECTSATYSLHYHGDCILYGGEPHQVRVRNPAVGSWCFQKQQFRCSARYAANQRPRCSPCMLVTTPSVPFHFDVCWQVLHVCPG